MARARTAIRWALPGLCAGLMALPAAAAAAGGGASAPTAAPSPSAPASTAGALSVEPTTLVERQVALVSGTLPAGADGRTVWLQARASGGSVWRTVARSVAGAGGSFAIAWRTNRSGQLSLRVLGAGIASTSAVTATPQVALSVYRQVIATWYGLYGHRTACGERLTRDIVGLADRSLPCGTPVTVVYDGRSVTMPVIDRGPYGDGATLDLTHAAASELGFVAAGRVRLAMLALAGPTIAPGSWGPPSAPATGATGGAGTALDGGARGPRS